MFTTTVGEQFVCMAQLLRRIAIIPICLLAACSDTTPESTDGPETPRSPEEWVEEAHDTFWQTFRSEDMNRAVEATQKLEDAYQAHPRHANNTLLLGLSRLWLLAEAERIPSLSEAEIPALAFSSLTALQEARALAPNDHRIYSWLGPVMYGTAVATGNEEMAAEATALLDEGVALYPEFNLFTRAQQNSVAAVGSPELATAVDDVWASIELCIGQQVERAPSEIVAFVNQNTANAPRACGNSPLAAHNTEGFLLFFAELLAKVGETALARTTLEVLPQVPDYDAWPYRHLVAEQLANLEARVALFQNEDPSDDPVLISETSYSCSYCHGDTR